MRPKCRFLIACIFSMACLGLTACPFPPRLYKMDIRQGNAVTQEMISKLKPGMTKLQVKEVLGSPMLTHLLEKDRWDYYFSFKSGTTNEPVTQKPFSVFFKNDKLEHFSNGL